MTQTLFHLEPMWYAHTGNVRMMRCGVRTRKNVRVGRVRRGVLCTPPSRSVSCVWLQKKRLAVRSWVSCRCQLLIGLFQEWEKEDEVGGWRSFAKYSAQFVFSHSGFSWSWGLSWFPKRCFSVSGTNGLSRLLLHCDECVLCLAVLRPCWQRLVPLFFRQHFVNETGCDTSFFVLAARCETYLFVRCGPSISPKHPTNQWQIGTPCRFLSG